MSMRTASSTGGPEPKRTPIPASEKIGVRSGTGSPPPDGRWAADINYFTTRSSALTAVLSMPNSRQRSTQNATCAGSILKV